MEKLGRREDVLLGTLNIVVIAVDSSVPKIGVATLRCVVAMTFSAKILVFKTRRYLSSKCGVV